MFGAIGILAALQERHRTGRGQEVQSALFENCTLLAAQHMQQFLMTNEPPPPMPSRVSAWSVYDVFTLAGDEQLFIGATSDKHFQVLCNVIERPDLAADPALATNAQRVAVRPALLEKLGETLRHHRSEELQPRLEAAGIPYAPIVRPDQLVNDRHLIESGGLVPMQTEDGGMTQAVLLPLLMGGRRPGVRRPLPRTGEHTEAVLSQLPTRQRERERA
jgi:crotonobetainyl-CoA:carnitine CoA-transferase CaiB-like acyl-CoA transferase